jgi:uncharacterized protein (TIGR02466 family)
MASHKHRGSQYTIDVKISDVCAVDIFPTTVYMGKLNVNNDEILDDCYNLREKYPEGVSKSNLGGWQSEVYNLDDISTGLEVPSVAELGHKINVFANTICEEMQSSRRFNESSTGFWININEKFCYNVAHSHPRCDLVALYYAKILPGQGNLTLMRNDGSAHHLLYEDVEYGNVFRLDAEPEVVYIFPAHLIHYVEPNIIDDTRVSISFNLAF